MHPARLLFPSARGLCSVISLLSALSDFLYWIIAINSKHAYKVSHCNTHTNTHVHTHTYVYVHACVHTRVHAHTHTQSYFFLVSASPVIGGERRKEDRVSVPTNNILSLITPLLLTAKMFGKILSKRKESGRLAPENYAEVVIYCTDLKKGKKQEHEELINILEL